MWQIMVKAIQVLRIHLLELEKVNELCKDFCNRYITCLKTKMHSDNLLRNDLGGPYSPNQPSINLHPQGIVVPASALQPGNISMTTVNSQVVSALYQPVTMVTSQGQVVTQAIPQGAIQIQNAQVNLDLTSLLDSEDKKSKNKRGVLPKHATNIMRSWLFQHLMVRDVNKQNPIAVLQIKIQNHQKIMQFDLSILQHFWASSGSPSTTQAFPGQNRRYGSTPGSLIMDNLQSLSSDNATIAMQQAMMAEEEEDLEEDNDELQTTNVSDLGLEHSDSLE
uniref:PBX/knotted 1 homeobox 2 n=1 Tax=Chelydra serpentina TaxID=8475 RepID=A0A8C3TI52_CHESE